MDDSDSEYSHDGYNKNGQITQTTITAFDDFESKSMGGQMFNPNFPGQVMDPEEEAREEYMRKLMSFRKDELVLADDSDDIPEDLDENQDDKPQKEKGIQGVEDAYEIVERIEDKMNKVAQVVRGIDKRMSYNLRLIGSVIIEPENLTNYVGYEKSVGTSSKESVIRDNKKKYESTP